MTRANPSSEIIYIDEIERTTRKLKKEAREALKKAKKKEKKRKPCITAKTTTLSTMPETASIGSKIRRMGSSPHFSPGSNNMCAPLWITWSTNSKDLIQLWQIL
ncbi:hypothetical protein HRI_002059100 [Hibiscus trionum]|uniref:Uncharacterized protein n=1 Tax=Hibiscus trionum TaxID=183268 RepID=A0A9W7M180_HIBTR|nr:hypothetical protein HRI_002059100 [Hibiscus trionum]